MTSKQHVHQSKQEDRHCISGSKHYYTWHLSLALEEQRFQAMFKDLGQAGRKMGDRAVE